LTDLYMKFVLTVIACALSVIAGTQLMPTLARAFADCGDNKFNACYVTLEYGVEVSNKYPLEVRVVN
jgi:hypothetical protein